MTSTKPYYGEYLLVLSGSAQNAPFLKDWKMLKDSIRQTAGRPGWTDVSSTTREEIRRGWCNFTRLGNAEAAYEFFSKMPRVKVCLMKRSATGNYLLLHYNCSVTIRAAPLYNYLPCGHRVCFHNYVHGALVIPSQSILPSATQSMGHLGIVYCAVMHSDSFPLAGSHMPTHEGISLV